MNILYITNDNTISKSEALTWFKFYCERPDDLNLYSDLNSAKEFLEKKIIESQKHIDFIITDWDFGSNNAKFLLSWIRDSKENYSFNNFQFQSIPVLLIEDENNYSSYVSEGFDGIVSDFPTNHIKLKSEIKKVIKTWRYSLADDLDLIGLDPKTQTNYQSHRKNFISYYRLKVLTRNFVDEKSKKLNYIWSISNAKSLYESSEAFSKKMRYYSKYPIKYLEKEFHNFFLENPTFIKGENYISTKEEMLYEKHLFKNGTKSYDEVDFLNKPHVYSLSSPEVFEIKRQSQKIIRNDKKIFYSKAKKSFEQVNRYKAYMTSDNPLNQAYIKKYLGDISVSYEYTLLMGSLEDKSEYEDLIEKLKKDFNFEDINLLTYEELLKRHLELCDRLNEFNIFN